MQMGTFSLLEALLLKFESMNLIHRHCIDIMMSHYGKINFLGEKVVPKTMYVCASIIL